ncbi:MAG: hypothetical protein AB1445_03655 [Bacillota bacterium]
MPSLFATVPCEDAGSKYCPCQLALTGNCLACPVLNQGGACDDCAWSGTCVLVEAAWNRGEARPGRSEYEVTVVDRVQLAPPAFALEIKVPPGLVDGLQPSGSFLMVRPAGSEHWFNVPLSVARLDPARGTVTHFVQVAGPKTRTLEQHRGQLVVQGPFASGLVGRRYLQARQAGRSLLVAKGIGQGPALHLATNLLAAGGRVDALLGPGELGRVVIDGELAALGASVTVLKRERDKNGGTFRLFLSRGKYDLLVSAGSDQQHQALWKLATKVSPGTQMVYTNNAVMCCGEGICGSCGTQLDAGFTRACKARLAAADVLARN